MAMTISVVLPLSAKTKFLFWVKTFQGLGIMKYKKI